MDSTGNPSARTSASKTLPMGRIDTICRWLPLTLLAFAIVYGLLLASLMPQALSAVNGLTTMGATSPDLSPNLISLIWKAFIGGILAFALLFNLVVVFMLQRPGLAQRIDGRGYAQPIGAGRIWPVVYLARLATI